MDVNRYFVLPLAPNKQRSLKKKPKDTPKRPAWKKELRLATPEAYFHRQKKQKDEDKKRMVRIAARRTVKHNFNVRYNAILELQANRESVRQELSRKIVGRPATIVAKFSKDHNGKPLDADGFHLSGLEHALDEEDDEALNRSIVEDLFRQLAPQRMHEIDDLMVRFKDDEAGLFKQISEEFRTVPPVKSNPAIEVAEEIRSLSATEKVRSIYDAPPDYKPQPKQNPIVKTLKKKKRQTMKEVPADVLASMAALESSEAPKHQNTPVPEMMGTAHLNRPASIYKQISDSLPFRESRNKRQTSKVPKQLEVINFREDSRLTRTKSVNSVQSVFSLASFNTLGGPKNEEIKMFQKALDEEIKGRQYSGVYVLSIVESGGKWWVNKDPPRPHSSQVRRDSFLKTLQASNKPRNNL